MSVRGRWLGAWMLIGTGTLATAACSDATSDDAPSDAGLDAAAEAGSNPSGTDASTQNPGPDASSTADGGTDAGTDAADASDGADASDASALVQIDFTVAPTRGYAGGILGSVTVRVRDPQGQLVTAPTSVSLSLASGPGALGGIVVRDTTAGLATFDDLTVSKSGTYKLVATVSGVTAESTNLSLDAWQPYNGTLNGGTVRRVVVDPTDANVAFATTDSGGVYRTIDGAKWAPVAFVGTSTAGLAIDPVTTTTVYAGQGANGLFKSTDRGLTWNAANAGYTNKNVNALAIDKTNTQVLYWGTNTGLLKSTNGGGTWAPSSDAGFAAAQIAAVALAPSNAQTVYVQAYNQQVYKSANGGGTWTAMTGLPANAGVRSFAVDPTNDGTVYASLGESAGGVWKSTAGGAFTQVANAPVATASVQDIVIVPTAPQTMYLAAYSSNVFKSVDSGATWTNLNDNLHGGNTALALAMAADASTLYVGHYVIGGGGFSKSTNGGTSWADNSNGFVAFDAAGMAVDPANADTLLVSGGRNGLSRSTDKGVTYTKLGNAEGINWGGQFAIRFSAATPGTVFVGNNGGGIFKSTNAGVSFVRDTVLGNASLTQVAPSPIDANTVYAGGFGFGLTTTANGGTAWATRNTPSNPFIYVGGVAAHPTVAGTAYAGLADGLYRTVDSGQTWTKLTTPSPALSQPFLAFGSANTLYGASASSVQSSPDGNVWTDITTSGGVTVPVSGNGASYLGVFKVPGGEVVFVGVTSKGLWRKEGTGWTSSLPSAANILSMAQDPTQPRTLYMGVKGGGVYRSLSAGE